MKKRIFALLIALCLMLTFVGCGDSEETGGNTTGKVDVSLKDGTPKAPGDVFTLPDIKRSGDDAPVIVNFTKQAAADDSIVLNGSGFTDAKAYVYSQTQDGNGKAYESAVKIADDQTMAVTIDKSQPYSLYGVYVESSKGKSNMVLINQPAIWWIGLSRVTEGQELSIYGENLTYQNGNKAYVYLVSDDNKYCETEVTYADPYKVSIKVPKLENEKQYTVRLHSGHGGEAGFVDAKEKITFTETAPVKFNGKKINVADFGAKPNDKLNDDSAAIQAAVDTAVDGDILYFPTGTYKIFKSVEINVSIKIIGDGKDKSIITVDQDLEKLPALIVRLNPTEICDLGFHDVKEKGFVQANFIESEMESAATDCYSLYVHDCEFLQMADSRYRSIIGCIIARGYGVIIEDNHFEATMAVWSDGAEKVFIRNNKFDGTMYCGQYYNQNTLLLWRCDMYDASNNKFADKGYKGGEGPLNKDDFTVGRAFAIQQSPKNMYIANNEIRHAGLPDDNAGEQILIESLNTQYEGGVVSATEDSITLPDDTVASNKMLIYVINGTGKYQVRGIKTSKRKTITVDKPWDIVPDTSSVILICKVSQNFAIHNNIIDGYTNYLENVGATTGVQAFATMNNLFITNNTFTNMPTGICISPWYFADGKQTETAPLYNVLIANNTIKNTGIAVRLSMSIVSSKPVGAGPVRGVMEVGTIVKRNTISNCDDYGPNTYIHTFGGIGVKIGDFDINNLPGKNYWYGEWVYGTLVENNEITDCSVAGIYYGAYQGSSFIRNNTNKGGAATTGNHPAGKDGILF